MIKIEKQDKKYDLPLVPLDEVLECMTDKDAIVRMAAKAYYNIHYVNLNRLHNDRPNK